MKKLILSLTILTLIFTGCASSEIGSGKALMDQMSEVALADQGQPIHGFDPTMYLEVFPGLQPADFDQVEAFGGKYEYQNDELNFVRDESKPITSAEETVATEGYSTLLQNLHNRLGKDLNVDELVDQISRT